MPLKLKSKRKRFLLGLRMGPKLKGDSFGVDQDVARASIQGPPGYPKAEQLCDLVVGFAGGVIHGAAYISIAPGTPTF